MEDFNSFVADLIKKQEEAFKESLKNMVNVYEYIKTHNEIDYCEIIITKDGLIAKAHPSHTEFLKIYSGLNNEQILELDKDMMHSPLNMLLKYTECVAVWYNHYRYVGNLSKEQKEALDILIKNKIVGFKLKK